jgi:hypothetical protein
MKKFFVAVLFMTSAQLAIANGIQRIGVPTNGNPGNYGDVSGTLGGIDTSGWNFGDYAKVINSDTQQNANWTPGTSSWVKIYDSGSGSHTGCGGTGQRPCPQQK